MLYQLITNLYLGTRGSNVPIWYLDVRPSLWVLFSFQNRVPSSMLPISPVPSSLTNGQQNSGIKTEVIVLLNDIVATSRFYKITQQPVNITNHCLQSMYSYLSAAHLTEAVVERLLFILIHFLEFMKQFL